MWKLQNVLNIFAKNSFPFKKNTYYEIPRKYVISEKSLKSVDSIQTYLIGTLHCTIEFNS